MSVHNMQLSKACGVGTTCTWYLVMEQWRRVTYDSIIDTTSVSYRQGISNHVVMNTTASVEVYKATMYILYRTRAVRIAQYISIVTHCVAVNMYD